MQKQHDARHVFSGSAAKELPALPKAGGCAAKGQQAPDQLDM